MADKMTQELLSFIDRSPSCYHVVDNLKNMLKDYTELKESDSWSLKEGGKYYVIRKDSSIIAFKIPKQKYTEIKITASHSDCPTFKLKPEAVMSDEHYTVLNTEGYGGMIMYSWFDRPLSVAGRVVIDGKNGLETKLVNIDKDLMMIPSVAIHMNREVNTGYKFDAQVDTLPLIGTNNSKDTLGELIAKESGASKEEILALDLYLYNREKGKVWGAKDEFISARAIDDLMCAYGTMKGFFDSKDNDSSLKLCCVFDNEEVGSLTGQGADSTFLSDVLWRINSTLGYSVEDMMIAIDRGYMISADNGHAVHPNHKEYADPTNKVYMNQGIVIKHNSSQKYTTDALSEAMFVKVCKKAKVPVQHYTNKSNMPGGSTLGNIANRHVSIKTIDIGMAQLSMHSSYETAGAKDIEYLYKAIKTFYN